ncbi:clasp N terminal-domain-containing protein [Blastocladiella britannica]|nr:clasp N terminal-domain-containing protein [Blastocladiella britannica]
MQQILPDRLQRDLQEIATALALRETEQTWSRIDDAVKALDALIAGAPEDQHVSLSNFIRAHRDPITAFLRTDRTRLSGTACGLVKTLATSITASSAAGSATATHHPAEPFLGALIALAGRTNRVIVVRAQEALLAAARASHPDTCLLKLCDASRDAKMKTVPMACLQAVIVVLESHESAKLEASAPTVEVYLRQKCAASANEVRDLARKLLVTYNARFPQRAEKLINTMDPATRKYLLKEPAARSVSAPVDRRQAIKQFVRTSIQRAVPAPPPPPLSAPIAAATKSAVPTRTLAVSKLQSPSLRSTATKAGSAATAQSVAGNPPTPIPMASKLPHHHHHHPVSAAAVTKKAMSAAPATITTAHSATPMRTPSTISLPGTPMSASSTGSAPPHHGAWTLADLSDVLDKARSTNFQIQFRAFAGLASLLPSPPPSSPGGLSVLERSIVDVHITAGLGASHPKPMAAALLNLKVMATMRTIPADMQPDLIAQCTRVLHQKRFASQSELLDTCSEVLLLVAQVPETAVPALAQALTALSVATLSLEQTPAQHALMHAETALTMQHCRRTVAGLLAQALEAAGPVGVIGMGETAMHAVATASKSIVADSMCQDEAARILAVLFMVGWDAGKVTKELGGAWFHLFPCGTPAVHPDVAAILHPAPIVSTVVSARTTMPPPATPAKHATPLVARTPQVVSMTPGSSYHHAAAATPRDGSMPPPMTPRRLAHLARIPGTPASAAAAAAAAAGTLGNGGTPSLISSPLAIYSTPLPDSGAAAVATSARKRALAAMSGAMGPPPMSPLARMTAAQSSASTGSKKRSFAAASAAEDDSDMPAAKRAALDASVVVVSSPSSINDEEAEVETTAISSQEADDRKSEAATDAVVQAVSEAIDEDGAPMVLQAALADDTYDLLLLDRTPMTDLLLYLEHGVVDQPILEALVNALHAELAAARYELESMLPQSQSVSGSSQDHDEDDEDAEMDMSPERFLRVLILLQQVLKQFDGGDDSGSMQLPAVIAEFLLGAVLSMPAPRSIDDAAVTHTLAAEVQAHLSSVMPPARAMAVLRAHWRDAPIMVMGTARRLVMKASTTFEIDHLARHLVPWLADDVLPAMVAGRGHLGAAAANFVAALWECESEAVRAAVHTAAADAVKARADPVWRARLLARLARKNVAVPMLPAPTEFEVRRGMAATASADAPTSSEVTDSAVGAKEKEQAVDDENAAAAVVMAT